jgi:hypothetical protein
MSQQQGPQVLVFGFQVHQQKPEQPTEKNEMPLEKKQEPGPFLKTTKHPKELV